MYQPVFHWTKNDWIRLLTMVTRAQGTVVRASKVTDTLFINQTVHVLSYMTLCSKAIIVHGVSERWNRYALQSQSPSLHVVICVLRLAFVLLLPESCYLELWPWCHQYFLPLYDLQDHFIFSYQNSSELEGFFFFHILKCITVIKTKRAPSLDLRPGFKFPCFLLARIDFWKIIISLSFCFHIC